MNGIRYLATPMALQKLALTHTKKTVHITMLQKRLTILLTRNFHNLHVIKSNLRPV